MKRPFGLTIAASLLNCGAAWAQVSDGVVKLGVLNDMSSLYADGARRFWRQSARAPVVNVAGRQA
jgi:hypothetical protein